MDDDVILEAGKAGNFVTFLEIRMARFNNFREAKGTHDFTNRDGRHVLRHVGHPDSHGGIDGEVFDVGKSFAVLKSEHWRVGKL